LISTPPSVNEYTLFHVGALAAFFVFTWQALWPEKFAQNENICSTMLRVASRVSRDSFSVTRRPWRNLLPTFLIHSAIFTAQSSSTPRRSAASIKEPKLSAHRQSRL
jgi:hypothetical protein